MRPGPPEKTGLSVWQSPVRAYRARCAVRQGEQRFQVREAESDLLITVPESVDRAACAAGALGLVRLLRGQLRNWMVLHPEFGTSLEPLPVPEQAPEIVRRMSAAAAVAGVGPFAAVAGAIAQLVAENLAACFALGDVMIENGGDIYACSSRGRVVGLLPEPASGLIIGVRLEVADFPVSLCASSGRIGHSLSFGQGDLAVVRARDGALADAAATACGNMLRTACDVQRVLDRAREMPGIEGVFAQCGGRIGLWGLELAEA